MPIPCLPAPRFNRVAIIGTGLIGGSLGMAIRTRLKRVTVTGFDRPAVLRRARACGAISRGAASLKKALAGADLVALALPPSAILDILPRIARLAGPRAIVTDMAGVKAPIAQAARRLFPGGRFIGGHPMAGSEHSGIGAAHPLLFENALHVLTPSPGTPRAMIRGLASFYEALGARVILLDAGKHDRAVAAASHLPQLAAVALMNCVGDSSGGRLALRLGAGGFRDMTRIASSRFEPWRDVLSSNRVSIAAALRRYTAELGLLARGLENCPAALAPAFRRSRRLRNAIPKNTKGFFQPLADLAVFARDKPGQMARITGALARARINIKDMELMKVREGVGGTFRLSFSTAQEARQAARILRGRGFKSSALG